MTNKFLGIKTHDRIFERDRTVTKFTIWGHIVNAFLAILILAVGVGVIVGLFFMKSYRWGDCG